MALIHEKMYQNENLSQIDLKSYIYTLAEDLIRNQSHSIPVKLSVDSDLQTLGNDTLVPVALILNELITNSLKHAFKDVKEGNIDISISVQNLFLLTKYSGLDPEIGGGIDNNIYPRPRVFTLNLNFNF